MFVKAVQEMETSSATTTRAESTFETEVWRAVADGARAPAPAADAVLRLPRQAAGLKSRGIMHGAPGYAFSPQTWQIVDAQMGYRSFDLAPESA
jgi:hypothetical protein